MVIKEPNNNLDQFLNKQLVPKIILLTENNVSQVLMSN